MLRREVAKRVFAREFSGCRVFEKPDWTTGEGAEAEDPKSPNFVISPLGLAINRVFVVGVITEIDSLGPQNEMWKARIVDPTGAFTVYAGQFQPEAAIFLSTVEVPAFIAVTGKARIFEPEEGSVFVSIRAEEVSLANESIRSRWLVDAAEQTLPRLEAFSVALVGGKRGQALYEYMKEKGVSSELAEGISMAMEHEPAPLEFARSIRDAVKDSLRSVILSSEEQAEVEPDHKEFILGLLREMDEGKGIDYAHFIEVAGSRGVPEDLVEEVVRSLLADGQCYEPRIGVIRLVA